MPTAIPNLANRPTEPPAIRAGDVIDSSHVRGLSQLQTAILAEMGTGVMISQEWPEGQCSHSGAPPQPAPAGVVVPIAVWRIPILSDRHVVLSTEIRGYADDENCNIVLESVGGNDLIQLELPVGAGNADIWTALPDLDIGPIDNGTGPYEEIRMYISTAGGTGYVLQISASVEALASPLPNQRIDGAAPMSPNPAGAGLPLPASAGVKWREGALAPRERPCIAVVWSALDTAYDGPGEGPGPLDDEFKPMGLLWSIASLHPGHGVVRHARTGNRAAGGGDFDATVYTPMRTPVVYADNPISWKQVSESVATVTPLVPPELGPPLVFQPPRLTQYAPTDAFFLIEEHPPLRSLSMWSRAGAPDAEVDV